MSRCINRKRFNHQMATRRKHALRKQGLRSPVVLDPSSALPKLMAGQHDVVITAHQRQAKLSNPTANIRLSAKKVKKIKQRARIVQNFNRKAEIAMMESL